MHNRHSPPPDPCSRCSSPKPAPYPTAPWSPRISPCKTRSHTRCAPVARRCSPPADSTGPPSGNSPPESARTRREAQGRHSGSFRGRSPACRSRRRHPYPARADWCRCSSARHKHECSFPRRQRVRRRRCPNDSDWCHDSWWKPKCRCSSREHWEFHRHPHPDSPAWWPAP